MGTGFCAAMAEEGRRESENQNLKPGAFGPSVTQYMVATFALEISQELMYPSECAGAVEENQSKTEQFPGGFHRNHMRADQL